MQVSSSKQRIKKGSSVKRIIVLVSSNKWTGASHDKSDVALAASFHLLSSCSVLKISCHSFFGNINLSLTWGWWIFSLLTFFFPLVIGQSQANCLSEAMLGNKLILFSLVLANRFTIYFLFIFLDQLNKQTSNIFLQPNARIKYIKQSQKHGNARLTLSGSILFFF